MNIACIHATTFKDLMKLMCLKTYLAARLITCAICLYAYMIHI